MKYLHIRPISIYKSAGIDPYKNIAEIEVYSNIETVLSAVAEKGGYIVKLVELGAKE